MITLLKQVLVCTIVAYESGRSQHNTRNYWWETDDCWKSYHWNVREENNNKDTIACIVMFLLRFCELHRRHPTHTPPPTGDDKCLSSLHASPQDFYSWRDRMKWNQQSTQKTFIPSKRDPPTPPLTKNNPCWVLMVLMPTRKTSIKL